MAHLPYATLTSKHLVIIGPQNDYRVFPHLARERLLTSLVRVLIRESVQLRHHLCHLTGVGEANLI
ncbi:hypothetical protein [Acinetobacter radioresistens]|uniref:hypothetical protein n=1 Tax=Acinetobacter radioresistens TaxID=40216 RepID=UPI00254C89CA|nr:hypothetical protein [Acinetobacter radioresistens]MDK8755932.1 hypothetical protein [Acinetobacter radioresistens]